MSRDQFELFLCTQYVWVESTYFSLECVLWLVLRYSTGHGLHALLCFTLLQRADKCVQAVLQQGCNTGCRKDAATVLQQCCNSATTVLQQCCNSCYNSAGTVLHQSEECSK